jgi:quercetin dioxygenase-like cupin family protein
VNEPTIEDPVLRQRLRFRRAQEPDGGEVLHVEIWVDAGGGVRPHVHPAMEERFEVLAGRPSFLAGRTWRTAAAGEVVVVPAGIRHAYRNRGNEPVHLVCEARPPSTLQEFLEEVAALSRAGMITRHGLPKRPSTVLRAAALAERHREMAVLQFPPMPPPFLQRLLFPGLARLEERRLDHQHHPGEAP